MRLVNQSITTLCVKRNVFLVWNRPVEPHVPLPALFLKAGGRGVGGVGLPLTGPEAQKAKWTSQSHTESPSGGASKPRSPDASLYSVHQPLHSLCPQLYFFEKDGDPSPFR